MGIKIIHGDSETVEPCVVDMIFTDPPFEMRGADVSRIIERHSANHLVLITVMHQLLDFNVAHAGAWKFHFDFVLDMPSPRVPRNFRQPHYTHAIGAYFTRTGVKSAFSRKNRVRSDVPDANNFWPTIFRSRRSHAGASYAKDDSVITDILGSFEGINKVLDPFAGGGSTGIAADALDISAILIEKDEQQFTEMKKRMRFVGAYQK